MALYGESYSKFKASDGTVISLNHSTVEKQWAKTNLIKNKSVFTAETTFTKRTDDFATFIVTINIWKNSVPADVMNTILPYNHDTVNFMPHQDSGVYVPVHSSNNLVTNGDFASATGWSGTNWVVADGVATATGAADGIWRTDTSFILGETYVFIYDIISVTSGSVFARVGGAAGSFSGTVQNSVGTYAESFVYDGTGSSPTRVEVRNSGTFTGIIDNMIVLKSAKFYIESMTPKYVRNEPPILEDKLIIKLVSLEAIDASGSIP